MIDKRLLKLNFKTSASAIADLALPRVCVVCGQALMPGERHICLECLADLPLTRFCGMSHNPMADLYNKKIEEKAAPIINGGAGPSKPPCLVEHSFGGSERSEPGGVTGAEPPSYQFSAALFYYNSTSPYRKITQALKYHRDFGAGRMFARMLGKELKESGLYKDVDLVVPVPLHWTRKLGRGYNQAETIAAEVAEELGAKHLPKALVRCRRTGSQVSLSGKDRAGNMSGAFRVSRASGLAGVRHLLLIDDVFTTGSTLTACYEALREVIPAKIRISIATLGFVQNG